MGKNGANEVRTKASGRNEAVMEEDVFAKQEKLFTVETGESPPVE